MSKAAEKIQLPYTNRYDTIWEYKEAFLSGRIDFFSFVGPTCPICGDTDCYRQITPYFRYAIDLFPQLKKERVPIARFLCKQKGRTFSLLPIQLMPYFQYTVQTVIATLLLGLTFWQKGQRGFYGASLEVDPDSRVSPWLVMCWLTIIVHSFRRAHAILGRIFDLDEVRSTKSGIAWPEVKSYFCALGFDSKTSWRQNVQERLHRYSRGTGQFLFGTPSQQRAGSD